MAAYANANAGRGQRLKKFALFVFRRTIVNMSHFQVVFFERLGDILIIIILLLKAYSRRGRLCSTVQYCIVTARGPPVASPHNLNHLYYKQLSVSQSCFVYFPFRFKNNKSVKCPDNKNQIVLRTKLNPRVQIINTTITPIA